MGENDLSIVDGNCDDEATSCLGAICVWLTLCSDDSGEYVEKIQYLGRCSIWAINASFSSMWCKSGSGSVKSLVGSSWKVHASTSQSCRMTRLGITSKPRL